MSPRLGHGSFLSLLPHTGKINNHSEQDNMERILKYGGGEVSLKHTPASETKTEHIKRVRGNFPQSNAAPCEEVPLTLWLVTPLGRKNPGGTISIILSIVGCFVGTCNLSSHCGQCRVFLGTTIGYLTVMEQGLAKTSM